MEKILENWPLILAISGYLIIAGAVIFSHLYEKKRRHAICENIRQRSREEISPIYETFAVEVSFRAQLMIKDAETKGLSQKDFHKTICNLLSRDISGDLAKGEMMIGNTRSPMVIMKVDTCPESVKVNIIKKGEQ